MFVSDRLKRTKVSNVSYRLSRTIGLNCSAVSCHIGREKHDDVWKSENRGHRSIPSSCIASLSDAWYEWYRYYPFRIHFPSKWHVARPLIVLPRGPTNTHATSVFPSTWPAQEASNSSYILTTARPRVVLSNIRQHPTSASDQQQTTLLLNRVSINCNYGNDRFDNYIHQR